MFFVFGPAGQMYRGGPENLGRIASVRRVLRPQALHTRTGAEPPAFALEPQTPAVQAAAQAASPRAQDAVAAYAHSGMGALPERQPLSLVRDVMARAAFTVRPETIVNHAWQQLAERGVAQAPVVDGLGRVVGLLLRADMAPLDLLPEPGHIQQAIALARRPVADVMFSPIPTVSPDTDLRHLARVLLQTTLPGLPVTDTAGIPVGFVSRTDILRAVASDPPLDLWS